MSSKRIFHEITSAKAREGARFPSPAIVIAGKGNIRHFHTSTSQLVVISSVIPHMESVRGQARLIYDLITFNFDIDETGRYIERPGPGAVIPEELFSRILYYVSRDDRSKEVGKNRFKTSVQYDPWLEDVMTKKEILMMLAKPLYTLKTCSLVSRYWANRCREYIFSGRALNFINIDEAQAFRHYALQGSSELIPIHELIEAVSVSQTYEYSPKSFLHLVYIPQISQKLRRIEIKGPFTYDSPPVNIDTPHWSLSNLSPCISPAITGYRSVRLNGIQFPSFGHIIKYMKHFRSADDIYLSHLTWNDNAEVSLLKPMPTMHNRQKIHVTATDCTDNFLIGFYAATVYSDSPIHTVLDRDQQRVLRLVVSLRDLFRNLDSKSESPRQPTYYFLSTPPQTAPVEGLEYINLVDYRKQLEESCALRAVVFEFGCHMTLRLAIENNPSLQDVWPRVDCTYRFVCGNTYKRPFPGWNISKDDLLEVDLATLQPTGIACSVDVYHNNTDTFCATREVLE
ncbi:hypothetical protein BDY19DRAFT_997118 [Irpex rosettiformis]|uniref:Uncharacterized protein n=1 Tax=Irpex rosettiformis TaxID=378272 RepID=A0ACB8TT59_9APHY|nr:hypothetical protein BDY19DRAFT_997118 [Irpex rosettiformis]